jgi:hypothetical protein
MKLSVASIALILLFQTGCSLDLKMFGSQTQTVDSPSTSVKGNFPLGEPEFTAAQKFSLSLTPTNQFVFLDNADVIHVLSSTGEPVRTIDLTGTVHDISGLIIDNDGNILISGLYTMNGDGFIMKYSIQGVSLGEVVHFPTVDNGFGVFISKTSSNLKVASDGSIFVLTNQNIITQIEKYNAAGTLQQVYAEVNGAGNGQFDNPQNYVVNSDGTLYVVDWSDRVQKLKADGTYDSKFTWPRQGVNPFINGFIRNGDGSFVLTERSTAVYLHKFDSTGAAIWMKDGSESGALYAFSSTPSLLKYNNQYYMTVNEILYIYDETGAVAHVYKKFMDGPTTVVRAKDGTFFIGDAAGIFKYSATGNLLDTFGAGYTFQMMAVSDNNILYTANLSNGAVINKYDLDGNSLGSIALGAGQVYGICADSSDNLFVSTNAGLKKILSSDSSVNAFAAGLFTGLHCNSDGTLYALNLNGTMKILKLNAAGAILQTFDHSGAGAIGVTYGLSVTDSGYAVVSDNPSNQIFVFKTSDGSFVRSFGSTGGNALSGPFGILIDAFNEIFIADMGNNFVKKFSLTGTALTE